MPLTRHRGRAAHCPSVLKWGLMLNKAKTAAEDSGYQERSHYACSRPDLRD